MLEYNTSRNHLVIKEYGRNVQKMIEFAIQIEDRNKRNETAKAIVRVMAEIHPDTKELSQQNELHNQTTDYWRKLWDHLIIISNYQLEVDAPFEKPNPELKKTTAENHRYDKSKISFRTYGRNMETIIKQVAKYPLPQREIMGKIVASHLKKLYILYNKNTVSDDLIIQQIKELSGGAIIIPSDYPLVSTKDILRSNGNFHLVQVGSNKKAGKKTKWRKKK